MPKCKKCGGMKGIGLLIGQASCSCAPIVDADEIESLREKLETAIRACKQANERATEFYGKACNLEAQLTAANARAEAAELKDGQTCVKFREVVIALRAAEADNKSHTHNYEIMVEMFESAKERAEAAEAERDWLRERLHECFTAGRAMQASYDEPSTEESTRRAISRREHCKDACINLIARAALDAQPTPAGTSDGDEDHYDMGDHPDRDKYNENKDATDES